MTVQIEIEFESGSGVSQTNTTSELRDFIKANKLNKEERKIPTTPLWIKFAFAESKKYPRFGSVKRVRIEEKGGVK